MLPSNDSLHEDLILEELEVFKVSRLLSSPSLSSLSFRQNQRKRKEGGVGKEGGEGELGQDTKGEKAEPTMAGGIQELAVIA